MEAIIAKLIAELNSAVFLLLAILFFAFWAMFQLGSITKTFKDFKDKNKTTDTDIGGIKDSLAAVRATTELLYQAHLAQAHYSTVQRKSPITLTEKGEQISAALKITEKIANHWDDIKTEVKKRSPINPYDIQTAAMDVARNCFDAFFSDTEKSEIKLYAYNAGMDLLEIYPIIGILVRDKILAENGIAAEEVDAHAPKNP
ncbi:MAG: hypothetical protein AAB539_03550 [Patescibacteria group bacterium]